LFGLTIGIALAGLLTLIYTIADWSGNPGGIFRDASGTNWGFVFDTAVSWFVPVFLYTFFVAAGLHFLIVRLMQLASRKQSGESTAQDNEKG